MTINTVVLILVAVGAVGALGYALYNFFSVKKMEEGSVLMQETAQAIRIGAGAFISYEFKIILIVGIAVAILLGVLISPATACAFLIGATMSELAGFIGMKIATYANTRTANGARESLNKGRFASFMGDNQVVNLFGQSVPFGSKILLKEKDLISLKVFLIFSYLHISTPFVLDIL